MVSSNALIISCFASVLCGTSAFQPSHFHRRISSPIPLYDSVSDANEHVSANFPSCSDLLSKNADAMKSLNKSNEGFTIFAPNEAAFKALGDKKLGQLGDIRNVEVAEKIAAYHVIAEPVTAKEMFNSGGIITSGGDVPIERTVSGGVFGVGGKEDGGVKVNGAKVLNSFEFPDDNGRKCIVHEVDNFISPNILWRYADQLRIPGSN